MYTPREKYMSLAQKIWQQRHGDATPEAGEVEAIAHQIEREDLRQLAKDMSMYRRHNKNLLT